VVPHLMFGCEGGKGRGVAGMVVVVMVELLSTTNNIVDAETKSRLIS